MISNGYDVQVILSAANANDPLKRSVYEEKETWNMEILEKA
jgi:hypothetical protein